MLDKDLIRKQFSLFSKLEEESVSLWQVFLDQREIQVTKLLREDITLSLEMPRICTAIAGLAYGDYCLITGGNSYGTTRQLKLGDITMGSSNTSGEGASLSPTLTGDHFLGQIQDLLSPTTGIFPVKRRENPA